MEDEVKILMFELINVRNHLIAEMKENIELLKENRELKKEILELKKITK